MEPLDSKLGKALEACPVEWLVTMRQNAFSSLDRDWANDLLARSMSVPNLANINMFSFDQMFNAILGQLNAQGVLYGSLLEFLQTSDYQLGRYLNRLAATVPSPFLRLNAALWLQGTFILVPSDTSCAFPLQAIRDFETVNLDRQLLILQSGSTLEYVTGCVSEALPVHVNASVAVKEVFVAERATLKFVDLENLAQPQQEHGATIIKAAPRSQIDLCVAKLGKAQRKHPIYIEADKDASISVTCLDTRDSPEGLVKVIGNPTNLSLNLINVNQTSDESLTAALEKFPMEVSTEIESAIR